MSNVVHIVSELLCVIFFDTVKVVPGDNHIPYSEYEKMENHKDFKNLVENRKMFIISEGQKKKDKPPKVLVADSVPEEVNAENSNETKEYSEMEVKDLRAIAKAKGLKGISQANKPELISALEDFDKE